MENRINAFGFHRPSPTLELQATRSQDFDDNLDKTIEKGFAIRELVEVGKYSAKV